MREIETSIRIEAGATRVWQVMTDFERWPEWTESVRRVEALDATPPNIGSRFRVEQPKLRPATWTVTKWEPAQGFTWESQSLGLLLTGVHTIETTGSACTVRLAVRFSGPLGSIVGAMARKITEQYVALESAGLKRRSETKS